MLYLTQKVLEDTPWYQIWYRIKLKKLMCSYKKTLRRIK